MAREEIFAASLDFFLSPIATYLHDDSVTEVMVNGFDEVYIERKGRLEETDAKFPSEDALLSAVHNVAQYVGREIDADRPVLDARLPDGSRVHAVIPPSTRRGTYLTIRKFLRDILGLEDFVRMGSLSESAKEFLELCVRLRKNIVVSGGTGTGKTTFLNALSSAIPEEERIVVIEDSSELRLSQKHSLYLESQQADAFGHGALSIRDLFKASLRMRPDRIIVGEVRSGEALDMVQSMISGHSGSMTTVHANSAHDAMVRLETLSLMSDVELPVYVARAGGLGDRTGRAAHAVRRGRLAKSQPDHRMPTFGRTRSISICGSLRLASHRPDSSRPIDCGTQTDGRKAVVLKRSRRARFAGSNSPLRRLVGPLNAGFSLVDNH